MHEFTDGLAETSGTDLFFQFLLDEPATEVVNVVGPICESGDQLGVDRHMPAAREGDVLLIATCGAYGRAMSST